MERDTEHAKLVTESNEALNTQPKCNELTTEGGSFNCCLFLAKPNEGRAVSVYDETSVSVWERRVTLLHA